MTIETTYRVNCKVNLNSCLLVSATKQFDNTAPFSYMFLN